MFVVVVWVICCCTDYQCLLRTLFTIKWLAMVVCLLYHVYSIYFSIMTVAKHMMTTVKESQFFASDSRLSYHSASSPVTYQPQRIWLLSDDNVVGRLLLPTKISPSRVKRDTSALRRCPVRPVGAYFPDNERRFMHHPLHIIFLLLLLY